MKKKKTLYYMLPLVILVWGFVFYQLYSYFFSKPSYVHAVEEQVIDIEAIQEDTFSIVANYRDPFLGKKIRAIQYHKDKPKRKTMRNSVKRNISSVKVDQSWPIIVYGGMIKNNNVDRRVGIVKINQKEHLIKEGDVVQEVKFLKINKEEIQVIFQKEKRMITK